MVRNRSFDGAWQECRFGRALVVGDENCKGGLLFPMRGVRDFSGERSQEIYWYSLNSLIFENI